MNESSKIRYEHRPDPSVEGAFLVCVEDGLEIGSLVPVEGDPLSYRIYYGHGYVQTIGRSLSVETGAHILGFYRRALLEITWLNTCGKYDRLHERFEGRR